MYIFCLLPVLWIWYSLVQIRIWVRVMLQVDPDSNQAN